MRHHPEPHCGCPRQIVYPTRQNVVHHCMENVVEHVHPSHTTVMNHHLTRNRHVFPHSTSVENTFDSVDEYGEVFNVPYPQQSVAGAMDPGSPYQVAGAMDQGYPNNTGVGPGYESPDGMYNWKKPDQWC